MPEITDAHLTADLVLVAPDERGELHLLTIRRSAESDAYPGSLALPGGYLDRGEKFLEAAVREVHEETGVTVAPTAVRQIGIYDDPDRDPRGRVVSVAFLVELEAMPTAVAGDDASAVDWIPLAARSSTTLAFDHSMIVHDAVTAMSHA